jgi:hypothetical protein
MRINGNLVFNTDASGELQNVYIERVAGLPTFNAAEKGRVIFRTSNALYYYNDGSAWVPFATGGNAAALQTEVDNIETSLGTAINSDGTWNGATAFSGVPLISGAGSITSALITLANYANANDTLAELGDVTLGVLSSGQFLMYNGTDWVNHTLVLADVSDVTATANEVNVLDGIPPTLTATELGYVDGVTSPIQTQLNNKQPLDAGLTALAAFNTNGILVQTADNTFAGRTLVAPVAGITIQDPDGVAGNPTFALANDLAALEGLSTFGYAVRTSADNWTTRDITGQAGRIVVTNGNGVASNTDIDLATVTDAGTGTFLKFTRDSYGRVSGTTAVVASDITTLVSSVYVDAAGDTMTGNLNMGGTNIVTGLAAPSSDTDAANKAYVDAVAAGLSWKQAVHAMSTTNVSISSAPATVDGYTLSSGNRVLLTGQTTSSENGIYVFNGVGNAMTRALDADAFGELNGASVFVQEGTTYADTGWVQTTALTSFSGQVWVQFSGSNTYTWGIGLMITGNTVDVNLGAGITQLPSDEVGIDLYSASGALILTTDGSTPSSASGAGLFLKLAAGGGLTQDTSGLYVAANGITNAMILNDSHGLNADSGTGSLDLGQTLLVVGTPGQGIVTSVSGQTFTITASDAAYSQKGVASFNTNDFTVTAGAVSIKLAGVDNNQLANSTITFAGSAGTPQAVDLGATITFGDGGTHTGVGTLVKTTAVATNQLNIAVREAGYSLPGVASFNSADFTVTSGAVSVIAKNLDSLTDVAITSPSAGQTLVYSTGGSQFVNRSTYYLYTSGGANTTHTVTHNLGQKYCNVTVVDSSDEVVIPQSITFDSATQLTVTFTSAINCKVVVMGVNAA